MPSSPQVLLVGTQKGGVGKTTLTAALARLIASPKRKVLVVDLEPRADCARSLGGDPALPGIGAMLLGQEGQLQPVNDWLGLIAGGRELKERSAEIEQISEITTLAEILPLQQYDVVLVDLPGNAGLRLQALALSMVTRAFVLAEPNFNSIEGAKEFVEAVELHQAAGELRSDFDWSVVFNNVDMRRSIDQQAAAMGKLHFPGRKQFIIPSASELIYMANEGRDLAFSHKTPPPFIRQLAAMASWALGTKVTP